MKVLTVNLRQGGHKKTAAPLVEQIATEEADVIAFTEFRANLAGTKLLDALNAAGYRQQTFNMDLLDNSVLMATKSAHTPTPFDHDDDSVRQYFKVVEWNGVLFCGIYIPQNELKPALFTRLISFADTRIAAGVPAVLIGDFNTGRAEEDMEPHPTRKGKGWFASEAQFRDLETRFTEAWRFLHPTEREYSRFGTLSKSGNYRRGHRVDHAFLSPNLLPRLRYARYLQAIREANLTDHAPLLVEIADNENDLTAVATQSGGKTQIPLDGVTQS